MREASHKAYLFVPCGPRQFSFYFEKSLLLFSSYKPSMKANPLILCKRSYDFVVCRHTPSIILLSEEKFPTSGFFQYLMFFEPQRTKAREPSELELSIFVLLTVWDGGRNWNCLSNVRSCRMQPWS